MGNYSPPILSDSSLTMGSAITLTKNSQFFVRQGDVERLISQGFLQKLN
jgi:hypothetical protein